MDNVAPGEAVPGITGPEPIVTSLVAQKGGMAVVVDSGIRRGADVLNAMAPGAGSTFVGRPFLFAALGGVAGVEPAIRPLQEAIDRDIALVGATRLSELLRHTGRGGRR